MQWLKGWQGEAALWIVAVFGFALVSYMFDGEHASYAMALKEKLISKEGAALFGFSAVPVLGVAVWLMFETTMAANAAVIVLCAVWMAWVYLKG